MRWAEGVGGRFRFVEVVDCLTEYKLDFLSISPGPGPSSDWISKAFGERGMVKRSEVKKGRTSSISI
jgi:hypothetical protein